MAKTKTPTLIAEKALDVYLEQLLKAANIAGMPIDYKKSYKERLGFEVERRIGLVVMNELEKKDLEEFEKLLGENVSSEEIQKFVSSKISNFTEVVKKGLDDFAAEFIAAAKT